MAMMDPQALPLPAVGAGQSLRMKQLDELAVAGVLVHVVVEREIHRCALHATRGLSLEPKPFGERPSRGRARNWPHEPMQFLRKGAGPRVMAVLRNWIIDLCSFLGKTSPAAANRHDMCHPRRLVELPSTPIGE